MAIDDMDRVVPLGQLDDFRVAEGEPDVRGWEVRASDGRKIGEVDELLVDTAAMKVRYLDVDVDEGMLSDGQDRHVLIPIGYGRLERDHHCVRVEGLSSSDLHAIPTYGQGPLTRDFEASVRDSFSSRRGAVPPDAAAGGGGLRGTGMPGGALSGEGGMMDTAGLDNTPGLGTGLGMTGVGGGLSGGMRAGGSELDTAGSIHARGSSAGVMGTGDDGMEGVRMGAGGQGPAGGLEREMARGSQGRGDGGVSVPTRSAGNAGSDYLHQGDGDFYAGDAFDDARFYGRAGGAGGSANTPQRGDLGLSAGTGGMEEVDMLRGSGLSRGGGGAGTDPGNAGLGTGDTGTDPDATARLAQEGRELLREDHQNRDVGGTGPR